MYIHCETYILRVADNAIIPLDPENSDFAAYLAWVDAGNAPQTPTTPTLEQRAVTLLLGVDEHLNAAARAKGYDDIRSAALRAALPASPFHDEGVAFGNWMDQVYATCYQLMAQVQAGTLPEPNLEQLLQMLPALELPA